MNLIELFEKGGYLMWPILGCSILSIALMIERILLLRNSVLLPPQILKQVESDSLEMIEKECVTRNSPLGRIFLAVIDSLNPGVMREEIVEAANSAGRKEIKFLERRTVALQIIASVTPLLGLLGTAAGMVDIFEKASEVGLDKPEFFSEGIYHALLTTVFGLTVAIPSLIAYGISAHRIEQISADFENEVSSFLKKPVVKRYLKENA